MAKIKPSQEVKVDGLLDKNVVVILLLTPPPVIVDVLVSVHPFASVTITVYVPENILERFCVV